MATSATRRDSQELAMEAAERNVYGMDVDYELPTPRPQQNEEVLQILQQMQQKKCNNSSVSESLTTRQR